MIGFLLYAFGSWYLVAKHRRTLAAALWLGASALGIFFIAYLHYLLGVWSKGAIYLPAMRSMLYPFGVMVLAVGGYIAILPRPRLHCLRCDHDLSTLPRHALICPSCGLARAWRAHGHRCAICKYDLSGQDEDVGTCPECGSLYTHRIARQQARPSESVAVPASDAERQARRERFVRDRVLVESASEVPDSPGTPTRP